VASCFLLKIHAFRQVIAFFSRKIHAFRQVIMLSEWAALDEKWAAKHQILFEKF
jgi:hypothetical protein